jgi:hypothetical protein
MFNNHAGTKIKNLNFTAVKSRGSTTLVLKWLSFVLKQNLIG